MGDGAQGGAGLAPPAFPPLAHLLHTLCCPCFYPGFGQGTRAKARKTSRRILPWAAGEPGGAEVSCLFKVQTSAVNLLPVCISLEPLSAGPGGGGNGDGVSPLCGGRVRLLEMEVRKHRGAAGTCFGRERFFLAIYDN